MIWHRRRRSGLELGRRQRPRIAAWATVLVVAAIVIGEVTADVLDSATSASKMAAKSYAVAVVPVVEESTALRLWLSDVRQHAVALGRLGVETALGRLVTGTQNLEYQLADLGISPPDRRSAELLSDVLARRATAARLVMGGVALAIGPSRDVTAATGTLLRAGEEIARSDGDYVRFVASLPSYVRRSVSLPSSSWDTPSQWTAPAVAGFAALLGSSPRLLVHRALLIVAVSLQPAPLRIVGLPPPANSSPTTSTTTTTTSTTTTLPGAVTSSSVPAASTTSSTSTTVATSTTSTTTTTLQVPPAGSVSCLQPTRLLSVDVVVANAGDVAAANVDVSASLAQLPPPPVGGTSSGKGGAGGTQAASTSCGRAQGPTGGSSNGGGAAGRPAKGGVTRTVEHVITLMGAGSSADVALPPISVDGGGTYMLTVRLGSAHESVRLQVASG